MTKNSDHCGCILPTNVVNLATQLHLSLPFRYWLACLQSVGWSITVGLFDFSFLTSSWISQSFLRGFFGKPKHLSAFLFAVLQKFFFYFLSVANLFVQCTRWGRPLFKYSLACKTFCRFLLNCWTSLQPQHILEFLILQYVVWLVI